MKIICLDELGSTQSFLCEKIRSGEVSENTAIYAIIQSSGVGSRDNEWLSKAGNLHLSFCINLSNLPSDLKLSSASIYFAFLFKELLQSLGSQIWLKWPNDLYVGELKAGGVISNKINDFLVVGVGLNLVFAPKGASLLDINVSLDELVKNYIKNLENLPKWKQIFSKYMIEFEKSRKFSVHFEGKKLSLDEAFLYEDGSILLENKRVYSLR